MCINKLSYLAPFFPLVTRGIMAIGYFRHMSDKLEENEKDRQNIRSMILPMMGFSFTGSLALLIVNGKVDVSLQLPAYYLMISFLCYLFVLNLQGYKDVRWQDNFLGDGLMEAASLSLILSIVYIVQYTNTSLEYKIIIIILALLIWLLDHCVRLHKLIDFLSSKV